MAGPSMGKIAQFWAQRSTHNQSLTQVMSRLLMKLSARSKKPRHERANRIDILIGESGIGKSTILGLLADRLAKVTNKTWRHKLWHVGTQGFEDNTGLPIVEERKVGEHVQKVATFAKADHVPGAVWWPDGFTLGILDELPSAPTLVQNQIREIIDGQLNGSPIDPNCLYVATGNPPDPRFVTVNALDAAIEKRLKVYIVVPTSEELLQVWSSSMPDMIYKFLLMHHSFIDTLSPREWEGISKDVQDLLDGGGSINDALQEASDELIGCPNVEVALRKFIKFGEDPYYYPILGRDIIDASQAQMRTFLTLLTRWIKDDQRGLVGASNSDLVRAIAGLTTVKPADKPQTAQNIYLFMELLAENDCVDMAKMAMESFFNNGDNKGLTNDVCTLLRKSKALKKLADTVTRYHASREKLHAVAAS